MFEKQKMWVKEKGKKVKGWYNRNKLAIGFGAGFATMAGLGMLYSKIYEPVDCGIDFSHDGCDEGEFLIRTAGVNRFGGSCHEGPWVRGNEGYKARISAVIDHSLA